MSTKIGGCHAPGGNRWQGSNFGATSGKEQDGELLLHEETSDESQQGTGSALPHLQDSHTETCSMQAAEDSNSSMEREVSL